MKFGWIRELPDIRDFTVETVKPLLGDVLSGSLPSSVDLRQWCSAIDDQGSLGSCTANAGVGLLEYFERKAFGKEIQASRMFLYKVTRNLMNLTGDTGADIRSTMGAMTLIGIPPEKHWSYNIANYDDEPDAFVYSLAENYKAVQYYKLDPSGTTPTDTLTAIKTNLAAGLPSMFGFTCYSSLTGSKVTRTGDIPYPSKGERVIGGHAIDAFGYDDDYKIGSCVGAILIRNSWSTAWGGSGKGYGHLPYDYVLKGLAVDWWSLVKADWIDSGQFGI